MKKFLAIFLILCLCLGVLAGCDEPSSGPGGIPPAGDGETPDGGNTNPDGGNTTPPAPDSDARTTVTEEEFEAVKAGNFQNYTMWAERIFSNGEKFDGYAVDYINYVDGKLVFYAEEMTEGKKTGSCAFFHGGKYWCGSYNTDTGKWNVNANGGYSISYPAEGMPFAFSDFTYDAEKGEYRMLIQGVDKIMTPEQIAAGFGDLMLRFEDGKLVKMGQPMNVDETKGVQYYVMTIGDYGTTVVPTPPEADIVFNDNNGSVSPDFGGDNNEDMPPPSFDQDDNNNNNNGDSDKDVPDTDDKEAITVWVSSTGKKYHSDPSCSNMKNPKEMTLKRAEYEGYSPCKNCH